MPSKHCVTDFDPAFEEELLAQQARRRQHLARRQTTQGDDDNALEALGDAASATSPRDVCSASLTSLSHTSRSRRSSQSPITRSPITALMVTAPSERSTLILGHQRADEDDWGEDDDEEEPEAEYADASCQVSPRLAQQTLAIPRPRFETGTSIPKPKDNAHLVQCKSRYGGAVPYVMRLPRVTSSGTGLAGTPMPQISEFDREKELKGFIKAHAHTNPAAAQSVGKKKKVKKKKKGKANVEEVEEGSQRPLPLCDSSSVVDSLASAEHPCGHAGGGGRRRSSTTIDDAEDIDWGGVPPPLPRAKSPQQQQHSKDPANRSQLTSANSNATSLPLVSLAAFTTSSTDTSLALSPSKEVTTKSQHSTQLYYRSQRLLGKMMAGGGSAVGKLNIAELFEVENQIQAEIQERQSKKLRKEQEERARMQGRRSTSKDGKVLALGPTLDAAYTQPSVSRMISSVLSRNKQNQRSDMGRLQTSETLSLSPLKLSGDSSHLRSASTPLYSSTGQGDGPPPLHHSGTGIPPAGGGGGSRPKSRGDASVLSLSRSSSTRVSFADVD